MIHDDELPDQHAALRALVRNAHRTITGTDTPMSEWTNEQRVTALSMVFAGIAAAVWQLPEEVPACR